MERWMVAALTAPLVLAKYERGVDIQGFQPFPSLYDNPKKTVYQQARAEATENSPLRQG
jgi:hypothetical protein